MKKCLSIIFVSLVIASALGCIRQSDRPVQSIVSNAISSTSKSELEDMPDSSFSKEDYQKLLALRFDGYEDMTISEYQRRVAEMTDTREYIELVERFLKSKTLYELKDTNETASFLFYILPLAGDEWESRNYNGEAAWENGARLEYSVTLTILDADALTIREYNTTHFNIISGMQDISLTSAAFQNDIDSLIEKCQTEKIGVSIEYAYFPPPAQEGDKKNESSQGDEECETRRYPNGTEEDYRSLLALKTPNYQDISISDFNHALSTWIDEDYERMERVDEDTKWNDFHVTLTAEELSFVRLTVFLSSMENGKLRQSIYTGNSPSAPYYGEYLPQKAADETSLAAWCDLYYQFSYNISDTDTVTVGERDHQIDGMITAIRAFWDETDIEDLLQKSESDIVIELEQLATAHSTDNITITIDTEQVHFERIDERQYTK